MSDLYQRNFSNSKIVSEFFKQKKYVATKYAEFNNILDQLNIHTSNLAYMMPLYGKIPQPLIEAFFHPHYDYLGYCYTNKEANAPYYLSEDLENELQTSFSTQRFKEFFTSSSFCTRNAVSEDVIPLLDKYIAALEERKAWQEVYERFTEVENSLYSITGRINLNATAIDGYTKEIQKQFTKFLGCKDYLQIKQSELSNEVSGSNMLSKTFKSFANLFNDKASVHLQSSIKLISDTLTGLKSRILFRQVENDVIDEKNISYIYEYGSNVNAAVSASYAGAYLMCVEASTSLGHRIVYNDKFEVFYEQYRVNCDKLYSDLFYKNHPQLAFWIKDMDHRYDDTIKAIAHMEASSLKAQWHDYTKLPDFIKEECIGTRELIGSSYSYDSEAGSSEHNDVTIELQRNKPDSFKENTLYVYLKDAIQEVDKNVSDSNNATNANDQPSREYDLCMSRDSVEACPDNIPYSLQLILKGLIDEGIINPANITTTFEIFNIAQENRLIDKNPTLKFPETEEPESGIFNQVYGFLYDNSPSAAVLTTVGLIAATSAIIYYKFLHPRPEISLTVDQLTQVGKEHWQHEIEKAANEIIEFANRGMPQAGTPGTITTEESFEIAERLNSEPPSPLLEQAGD